jgi:hypothetical protein
MAMNYSPAILFASEDNSHPKVSLGLCRFHGDMEADVLVSNYDCEIAGHEYANAFIAAWNQPLVGCYDTNFP